MTPELINIHLITRGISKTELARRIAKRLGTCSQDQLTRTINGDRKNEHIRAAMADELKMPVDELFGADHEAVTSARRLKTA